MVEEILPKGYLYKIIKSSIVSPEDFECEFRCNVSGELEFCKWLKEFQSSTNTYWIVRNSVSSEASLFRLSRDYLCQHSSFRKKKEDGKDKKCTASLNVRMKRDSQYIRYRDPFVREGYFTKIKINFKHSHSMNDTEIQSWLPRTDRTKQIFIDYFDAGMTPGVAKKYHESMLLVESPDLLQNSSVNPPASWIYSRYQKYIQHRQWLDENVGGLNTFEPVIPIPIETIQTLQNIPPQDKEIEEIPDEAEHVIPAEEYNPSPNDSEFNEIEDMNEAEPPCTVLQGPYADIPDPNTSATDPNSDEEMTDESYNIENMPSNGPDKYEIVPKFCYQMDRIAHLIEKCDDDTLLCMVDKFANKASNVSSVPDLFDFFDAILTNHSVWKKKLKLHQASASRRRGLFAGNSLTLRILRQNAAKRKNINKHM